jgi:hypothetical protein
MRQGAGAMRRRREMRVPARSRTQQISSHGCQDIDWMVACTVEFDGWQLGACRLERVDRWIQQEGAGCGNMPFRAGRA